MTIDDSNALNVHDSGSSRLAVKLSLAEATDYNDGTPPPTATNYWLMLGFLAGGDIERNFDVKEVVDEAGQIVRNIRAKDQWMIKNSFLESDVKKLFLLEELLSKTSHRFRYPLPNVDGTWTIYGFYNGTVKAGWKHSTKYGEARQIEFEITGSKTADKPAMVYAVVDDVNDQTAWPAVLNDFKD